MADEEAKAEEVTTTPEEQNFLPGGVPAAVVEEEWQAAQDRLAAYTAAQQAGGMEPEIPPAEGAEAPAAETPLASPAAAHAQKT